jgi:hypothetical protein
MNFMLGFIIEILGKCKLIVVLTNWVRLNVDGWKILLEIEEKLSIKEMIRATKNEENWQNWNFHVCLLSCVWLIYRNTLMMNWEESHIFPSLFVCFGEEKGEYEDFLKLCKCMWNCVIGNTYYYMDDISK